MPHPLLALLLVTAPLPAAEGRYVFRTLGGDLLERALLVAHVEVEDVARAAPAASLVRFRLLESLLDRRRGRRTEEVVALAAPGEYLPGADYLVFLESPRRGGWPRSLRRIAGNERDFGAKLRVLRDLCRLEGIEDAARRDAAIRDLLLENVVSDDRFARWNAVSELRSFAAARPRLFGPRERRRLAAARDAARSANFRRALGEVLRVLAEGRQPSEPAADGGREPARTAAGGSRAPLRRERA